MGVGTVPLSGVAARERARWRDEWRRLDLRTVAGGCAAAIWAIINIVADASLIYSGRLELGLITGAAGMLTAFGLVSLITAFRSGVSGMAVTTVGAVVYAAMAVLINEGLEPVVPDPVVRSGMVAAVLGLATGAVAVVLLVLGALRMGSVAQLLPYPVIAGYFAGISFLLAVGGVHVASGLSIDESALAGLGDPTTLARAGACLFMAAVLLFVPRLWPHWSSVPLLLLAGVLGFHLLRVLLGADVLDAQRAGWLLGPFPRGMGVHLPGMALIGVLDWNVLASLVPYAASASVLAAATTLLSLGALELDLNTGIDANEELKTTGLANVLAGAVGGTACTPSAAATSLLHRLGGGNRFGAVIPGLAAIAVMAAGPGALGLMPRFLIGAVLLSFGIERLFQGWQDGSTLPRHDVAIVLLVLGVTAWLGIVPGLEAGIVLALLMFLWNYRRLPVTRPALSGTVCRSSMIRSPEAEAVLRRDGGHIAVYRLQGFLFFLNAGALRTMLLHRRGEDLAAVVLDFHEVVGMDSSAHASLRRAAQLAAELGARLLLCGLTAPIEQQLRARGLLQHPPPHVHCLPTLDLALQDAEDALLARAAVEGSAARITFADWLEEALGQPVDPAVLAPYLETMRVAAGQVLMHQGEQGDSIYFVERGRTSVWIERQGAPKLRVAGIARGGLIGELALYRGGERTATVIADEEAEVCRLDAASLRRMERDDPALAALLSRCLIVQLADKVANSSRLLGSLLR